jgi:hypothetical protein
MSGLTELKPVTEATIAFWRTKPNFTAWQAASLFFDLEPPPCMDDLYGRFKEGYVQAMAEELVKYRTSGGNSWNGWERVPSYSPTGRLRGNYPKYGEPAILSREALVKAAIEKGMRPRFLEGKLQINNQDIENELNPKHKEYLMRTIGALALLLIERQAGGKFGTRAKPNRNAIFGEIDAVLSEMGMSIEGQSKSRLYPILEEAIDLAMKKPLKP